MITENQVIRSIKLLTSDVFGYLSASATEKRIASSLEVYMDRGEFDGTLPSAIECLTLAGYEIEMEGCEDDACECCLDQELAAD